MEYKEQIMRLGYKLLEFMSEALGLDTNHTKDMDCGEGLLILCHYYPACPQPELTMGSPRHSDNDFLTILQQDQIGGLQVLYQNQWVDVPPVPGALVINVGDVLQVNYETGHCILGIQLCIAFLLLLRESKSCAT